MGALFDSAVEFAHGLVEAGGYAGLAAAIALENVFPPVPSEINLPLAGVWWWRRAR
jgi:membrane protein DedA with SNARE-associated domain